MRDRGAWGRKQRREERLRGRLFSSLSSRSAPGGCGRASREGGGAKKGGETAASSRRASVELERERARVNSSSEALLTFFRKKKPSNDAFHRSPSGRPRATPSSQALLTLPPLLSDDETRHFERLGSEAGHERARKIVQSRRKDASPSLSPHARRRIFLERNLDLDHLLRFSSQARAPTLNHLLRRRRPDPPLPRRLDDEARHGAGERSDDRRPPGLWQRRGGLRLSCSSFFGFK